MRISIIPKRIWIFWISQNSIQKSLKENFFFGLNAKCSIFKIVHLRMDPSSLKFFPQSSWHIFWHPVSANFLTWKICYFWEEIDKSFATILFITPYTITVLRTRWLEHDSIYRRIMMMYYSVLSTQEWFPRPCATESCPPTKQIIAIQWKAQRKLSRPAGFLGHDCQLWNIERPTGLDFSQTKWNCQSCGLNQRSIDPGLTFTGWISSDDVRSKLLY